MNVRQNWRVVALCILIVLSGVALFVPGAAPIGGGTGDSTGNATASGPTNLNYGLQLDGGTRIRAPVEGLTAEGVNVTVDDQTAIEQGVAANLGVETVDVQARPALGTVEVHSGNVTEAAFRQAVEAEGLQPETVRPGVTAPTRETIVNTIQSKLDATGFGGTSVTQVQSGDRHYVVIEVPGANTTRVRSIVENRGVVRMVAHYPQDGSQTNTTVLSQGDFTNIGTPQTNQNGRPYVRVVLTEQSAERFTDDMKQYGFTTEEGTSSGPGDPACTFGVGNDTDYCLLTVLDGNVVYSASVDEDLGRSFANGDFVKNPEFIITANNMSEARQLQINLRAGALPATLDLDQGDVLYVAPSRASSFKPLSLVTGLFAALAVSVVIFLRYGRKEIALPMLATALSEVFILLGFSASTGLALNLSHIAGFIAVIGTGVDDLVIIADEVMAEKVSSARIFQSRFRKALWIIGGAAATTIIAMSPLAVLSLGDLRGFAIVTIVGVLIGVFLTRPAYGDILRYLLTDEEQ
ncbi:preprotein translocase subunit SecD [Halocalculus aciditolerans]|uniref:Protein-export membrane protein SecD n=1 Tax=Halocalculus aciditolerans TaxID=1383812 RepID=A0A830F7T8_9EURY|nr:preprotein translocase subunit SecD [Halocalculus aciditolerans]GGL47773.1 preprotein translocase subunit SecD [Halocalculus aciditolerans]